MLLPTTPGMAAWPAALIVWGPGFASTAHRHHCVQLIMTETLVRTGTGIDFHRTLRDKRSWCDYQRAMLAMARLDAATIARLVPIRAGATHLLDLAGSHGLLGAKIRRGHPPMRSTVVDLPEAVEEGRALARETGNADSVDHRVVMCAPIRWRNAMRCFWRASCTTSSRPTSLR